MPTHVKQWPVVRVENNPNFRRFRDTEYYVSRMGTVKRRCANFDKDIGCYRQNKMICFYCHGKHQTLSRAIWECFKGEIKPGYRIVHINGCVSDNRLENLQMMTEYNAVITVSRRKRARRILNLATKEEYKDIKEAVKKLHYSEITLRKILTNKYKAKTSLKIRYIKDE